MPFNCVPTLVLHPLRAMALVLVGMTIAYAGDGQGRRIALVIGNGNYQQTGLPKLANPPHDAQDIAKALRGFGFEVIEKENQTLQEMNQAIAEFGSKIGGSEAALFYYAGHGIQVKNQNYLIPVNAMVESEASVPYQGVNLNQVLDEMDNGKSGANIVMLDACRNNPITGKFRSGQSRGLASPGITPKGTVIVYATDPGNVAADGQGRNGLFTAGLLTAFKGRDLSLDGVLTVASAEVEQASGQTQTPYVNGPKTLQKSFQFRASEEPTGSDAPSTPYDGSWGITLVCEDVQDKGALVKGYTNRFLVDVRQGHLTGQRGQVGRPDSLTLDGSIQADGTADIQANGFTGNPEYSVGHVRPSVPFSYHMRGTFTPRSGKATRMELRPCEATFSKN